MTRLSIGARWTLRSTAAMMVVVAAMAAVFYPLIEANFRKDALLVAELQVDELTEALEHQATSSALSPELIAYVDQHIHSASEELKLGIRIVDPGGDPLLERGIFRHRAFPPRGDFAERAALGRAVEVDVGESLPYLLYARALPIGYAEVAISTRPFLRGFLDLRDRFLEALPFVLALAAGLSWWLTQRSLAPIAHMTAAARRITASQLDEEIPTSGSGDELDSLATTLNAMMERVRTGVEQLRGFSSNAAHQLRTPLSLLRTRLEIAAVAERDANVDQDLLLAALGDVERLGDAIRGMLRLAESEGGLTPKQRRVFEIAPELEQVVEFFEPVATKKGVTLELDSGAPAKVEGDADWLRELFSNLIDNAVKYTQTGGRVVISASPSRDTVVVTVEDDGQGIAPDRLADVFERFERGADAARTPGTGLGLTVAREIARAHGGSISVRSEAGRGSSFTVRLPLEGSVRSPIGTKH
jgi:heavy metal sensor kinase